MVRLRRWHPTDGRHAPRLGGEADPARTDERDGAGADGFVIGDLNDFHLLVAPGAEGRVRRKLDAELEKNTYSLKSAER
jgi:hypothetical protein